MFLTSSLSSKGVDLHIEKSRRRALDSAGHNRIKEKHYFVFLSEHVYSQREAKSRSSNYRCKIPLLSKEGKEMLGMIHRKNVKGEEFRPRIQRLPFIEGRL